jgi:hypothetical protein
VENLVIPSTLKLTAALALAPSPAVQLAVTDVYSPVEREGRLKL